MAQVACMLVHMIWRASNAASDHRQRDAVSDQSGPTALTGMLQDGGIAACARSSCVGQYVARRSFRQLSEASDVDFGVGCVRPERLTGYKSVWSPSGRLASELLQPTLQSK